jgi:hypothetical protein
MGNVSVASAKLAVNQIRHHPLQLSNLHIWQGVQEFNMVQ